MSEAREFIDTMAAVQAVMQEIRDDEIVQSASPEIRLRIDRLIEDGTALVWDGQAAKGDPVAMFEVQVRFFTFSIRAYALSAWHNAEMDKR